MPYVLFSVRRTSKTSVHWNAIFTVRAPSALPREDVLALGQLDGDAAVNAFNALMARAAELDGGRTHGNARGWDLHAETDPTRTHSPAAAKALASAKTDADVLAAVRLDCDRALAEYEDPQHPAGSPVAAPPRNLIA